MDVALFVVGQVFSAGESGDQTGARWEGGSVCPPTSGQEDQVWSLRGQENIPPGQRRPVPSEGVFSTQTAVIMEKDVCVLCGGVNIPLSVFFGFVRDLDRSSREMAWQSVLTQPMRMTVIG